MRKGENICQYCMGQCAITSIVKSLLKSSMTGVFLLSYCIERSLLNYVPYVLSCLTCPRTLRALVPHLLRVLRALVPYVLSCPTCSRALRALVPYVLSCLTCFVPYVLSCPTCLVPYVLSCLTCLVSYVSRVLCGFVPRVL